MQQEGSNWSALVEWGKANGSLLAQESELQQLIDEHDQLEAHEEQQMEGRAIQQGQELLQASMRDEAAYKEEDSLYYEPSFEDMSFEETASRNHYKSRTQKYTLYQDPNKNGLSPQSHQKHKRAPKQQLTVQEQYAQIKHLSKPQQLNYIYNKVQHYTELKELITGRSALDESQVSVFNDSKSTVGLRTQKQRRNYALEDEQQKKPRRYVSPQILEMIKPKFQLYQAYENGKYKPQYQLSFATISSLFSIPVSLTADLYKSWLQDPSFKSRLSSLIKHKDFSPPIQHSTRPFKKCSEPKEQQVSISHMEPSIQKIIQIRYLFCSNLVKLKEKARVYYLDECPSQVLFGNGGKKEQLSRFSLMGVLGSLGKASWKVVHWLGSKYQQTSDIRELFRNLQEEEQALGVQLSGKKSYLILDPVLLKNPSLIDQIQTVTRSKVMLMPQLSKDLNPMEIWFDEVKYKLSDKTLNQLVRVLQMFVGVDFGKYLEEVERYIKMGLNKHAF